MGDCNACIISSGGHDEADFYDSKVVRARRPHICIECERPIATGEQYERVTAKWDGDITRYRTCLVCVEIRTKFSCDGTWMFGFVWEDIREYLFPQMTTGCLQGLSAASKQRLVDAWRDWKFGRKAI